MPAETLPSEEVHSDKTTARDLKDGRIIAAADDYEGLLRELETIGYTGEWELVPPDPTDAEWEYVFEIMQHERASKLLHILDNDPQFTQ